VVHFLAQWNAEQRKTSKVVLSFDLDPTGKKKQHSFNTNTTGFQSPFLPMPQFRRKKETGELHA